jgi:hypothetical protein
MIVFRRRKHMPRLALLLALMLGVSGCGSVTPGNDNDPIGAYRFSHGRTYGELAPRLPAGSDLFAPLPG